MTTAIVIIILLYLIPLFAYIYLKNTIDNNKENNKKEVSGFEVARKILDHNKLDEMYIVEKRGYLTDVYDRNNIAVKLSTTTFHDTTLYAMLMASFISSEAILSSKDNQISLKLTLNPLFDFITYIVYILIIVGLCAKNTTSLYLAICLLLTTIIYHLIIFIVNNRLITNSTDNLYRLKYYQAEDKHQIDLINNAIRFYNLAHIILCLFHLFDKIKEVINDSKRK